ncbi:VgrG protein [Citrobacter europaeus]|uniref:type VI secretion system Vgr family protein n=1 Tax=Citrobacter TaxID=544 RepID=UPI0008897232|nr:MULTISPECIES: type VI secretion system Vgr family protein [Citrobacter]MDM3274301.1 type VI secretion system tip protein VgrG [Citrobacter sp. Ce119]MDM3288441.1 type VI secretion system tip protein VgrG [Citrobacter sp. Ce105]UBI15333.1 type VI secretion system tip protein VgrG [Citrobacter europaeus]CAD7559266.1 VgrG protein [Citrobacter europaeus]
MGMSESLGGGISFINENTLNRYQLYIPSCKSVLDVISFNGTEEMSSLYRYVVNFSSHDKDIAAESILRKSTTLTMGMGKLSELTARKMVHGIVTSFHRISGSKDQATYQLIIEPFVALLKNQFRTHRFFINMSVPEVVTQILQEHGLKDWEYNFDLVMEYPKREQINQYQESDLVFIERLLSEVGIFFFFRLQPDAGTEVIYFADKQSAWEFGKTLPLNSPSGMNDNGIDSVWDIQFQQSAVQASVTAGDYNHRQAQKILFSAQTDMTYGEGDEVTYGDVYHYRPRHLETGDKVSPAPETGNFWARLEHERYLSSQATISGLSTDVSLSPAQVLNITESTPVPTLPVSVRNSLLVTAVSFSASRKEALQVVLMATIYSETRCWRPPLKPRPVISGTLMARVSSPKKNDEYAHLNQSGLYWVKFDADRDAKQQGYESMPVRLAKPYGGDTYGIHFPLIQGTEVAVAFHEGDPDRPYIAHALHDSRHPDHVTQANHTRNVIRTPANNKLRMEDKRGEEHVKLSTEYGGKTQLNLGHNVDAGRALRGEGFELRTDQWGAIRAGKGIFISADRQELAGGLQLDMHEAVANLQAALQDAKGIRSAAEKAKAELADIERQKALLMESMTDLKKQALLFSAPAGIAQVTPASIQLSSGDNVIVTSGADTDVSVAKKFRLGVKETISLFAQWMGIKIFASKGKVEIQAQGDAMDLLAKKTLSIASKDEQVIITAATELVLSCGGAYIRLKDGEIEVGTPGNVRVKSIGIQKMAPATLNASIELPDPCATAIDAAGGTQSPTVTLG